MSKISIIVAAYNIENYIKRCLESLISQTYNNIEIIVVNDGSTDNTEEVINNLSKLDKRICLINKKNEGLVECRKTGFEYATGDYILFIDGDDYLRKDAISLLYEHAKCGEYDIIQYNYVLVYHDGTKEKGWDYEFFYKNRNLEQWEFIKSIFTSKLSQSICLKFIKKSYILDNEITFPNNICYGEDLAISSCWGMYNPKVYVEKEPLYYYFQRPTSLTHITNSKVLEIYEALTFIKKQLLKTNLFETFKEEFEYLVFCQTYYIRIYTMFIEKNVISKELYRLWKDNKFNIDYKSNMYYKKLINSSKSKLKNLVRSIIYQHCMKYYYFAVLYYKKIRNI